MAKVVSHSSVNASKKIRPALSPEARENQLISLAVDLAERQLIEGTASSQVISHYLKLGSTKERVELEKLKLEKDMVAVKTENMRSAQRSEEIYTEVLNAMKQYSGNGDAND